MEMIWLIKGRFIKYLRVHTHVIHFLLRSGTVLGDGDIAALQAR